MFKILEFIHTGKYSQPLREFVLCLVPVIAVMVPEQQGCFEEFERCLFFMIVDYILPPYLESRSERNKKEEQ